MRTRTSGAAVDGVWTSGVTGEGRGPGGHGLDGVLEQDHRLVGGGGVAGEQAGAEPELHPAFQVDAVDLDEPGPDGGGEVQQQHPHRRRLARPGTPSRQRRHGDRDAPRLPVLGDTHLRRADGGCQVRGREPGLHHRRERVGEQEPDRAAGVGGVGDDADLPGADRGPEPFRRRHDVFDGLPDHQLRDDDQHVGVLPADPVQGRHPEFGAVLGDHPPSSPHASISASPGRFGRNDGCGAARPDAPPAVGRSRPAPGPHRRHQRHDREPDQEQPGLLTGSRRPCLPSRPPHDRARGSGTGTRPAIHHHISARP